MAFTVDATGGVVWVKNEAPVDERIALMVVGNGSRDDTLLVAAQIAELLTKGLQRYAALSPAAPPAAPAEQLGEVAGRDRSAAA